MLLHWEDWDSMAHSVESRVPFVDYRLMEYLAGLPCEHKIKKGITERILRDSLDGTLHKRIKNRKDKMGFVTAEEVWLKDDATGRFKEAVDSAIEASNGIIMPEFNGIF